MASRPRRDVNIVVAAVDDVTMHRAGTVPAAWDEAGVDAHVARAITLAAVPSRAESGRVHRHLPFRCRRRRGARRVLTGALRSECGCC